MVYLGGYDVYFFDLVQCMYVAIESPWRGKRMKKNFLIDSQYDTDDVSYVLYVQYIQVGTCTYVPEVPNRMAAWSHGRMSFYHIYRISFMH